MELLNIIFRCLGLLTWAIVGIGASIGAVYHIDCPYLTFFGICGAANLAIQGYFVAKHAIKLVNSINTYAEAKKAKKAK